MTPKLKPNRKWISCAAAVFAALTLSLTGCASPGAPQPPSLHLPRPVSDLQAQRVGDAVQLHWTMPEETTDSQSLTGPQKVTICRRTDAGVCAPVQNIAEPPSAKAAHVDPLPPALIKDSPALLTYEVEVLNATGRSAGASNLAYAASGAAPAPVSGLKAVIVAKGVMLSWLQSTDTSAEILLQREHIQAAAAAKKNTTQKNPLAPPSEPEQQQLRVHSDAGGTLDASAVFGEQYTYTVQRVEKLTLAGQSVELRSEPSAVMNVTVRDVFPPQPPQGLAASDPVRAADGSCAVDLSWEANTEPDLAGYLVYRDRADPATGEIGAVASKLKPISKLLTVPAFSDSDLLAGRAYVYSVTAIDKSGNESRSTEYVRVNIRP